MYVYLVFTEHDDKVDMFEDVFMYEEDACQYVQNINAEIGYNAAHYVRTKLK